jgi:hypothetical protein
MKEKKALQTITLFCGLSDPFLDFFLVLRPVLKMSLSPVVARARLVTDTLPRLEDVFQLAIQDLVVDDSALHVDHDCASLQVSNWCAGLQINLAILAIVHVPEERTQRIVIYVLLVVLSMFAQCELPESQTDLVPALPHLHRDDFSRH